MTQPNETRERIKEIRERRDALREKRKDLAWEVKPFDCLCDEACKPFAMNAPRDIDFLLSLIDTRAPVDSQGAGEDTRSLLRKLKDFLFDNCDHADRDRNYDWCPKCVMAFVEVLARPSESDAVTQMRTACVEKVKAWANAHKHAFVGHVIDELYKELESGDV